MFRLSIFSKKKPQPITDIDFIGKLTGEINNFYKVHKLHRIHRGALPRQLAARIIQSLIDNDSAKSPLSAIDFHLLAQLGGPQQEGIIFLMAYLLYKIESCRNFLRHTYSLNALVGAADAESTLIQTMAAIKPYQQQEKAKKLLPFVLKFISSLNLSQGRLKIDKNVAFGLAAAIAHFTDKFEPNDTHLQLFFQKIKLEFKNLFHHRNPKTVYGDLFFDPYFKNKTNQAIQSIFMMIFGVFFCESLNKLNKDIQAPKIPLLFTERENQRSYFSLLSLDIAHMVALNLGWEAPMKDPQANLRQAVETPSTADLGLTGINANVRQNP